MYLRNSDLNGVEVKVVLFKGWVKAVKKLPVDRLLSDPRETARLQTDEQQLWLFCKNKKILKPAKHVTLKTTNLVMVILYRYCDLLLTNTAIVVPSSQQNQTNTYYVLTEKEDCEALLFGLYFCFIKDCIA